MVQGQCLSIANSRTPMPEDIQAHLSLIFPDGIADHGERYLLNGNANQREQGIELLWEYVRRAHFPHRPSRMLSAFAWRSVEEAREFARRIDSVGAPVWELSGGEAFTGNMTLLNNSGSVVRTSQLAHAYWSGEAGPCVEGLAPPVWEVLLTGPVIVQRLVGPA